MPISVGEWRKTRPIKTLYSNRRYHLPSLGRVGSRLVGTAGEGVIAALMAISETRHN